MYGHKKDRYPLIDGEEQDCLTSWRKVLHRPRRGWKVAKNQYNRRMRVKAKKEIERIDE